MLAEIDAQATNPLPVPERAYEMGDTHPWCAPSEAARGHIRAQIPNQQRASAPPPVPPRESPTTRQPWLPGPRKRVRRVSRSAETERSMAASHTTRDMHGNTAGHTLFPDAKGEIPKVSTSIYTEPRPPSGGLAPTVAGAPTLIAGKLRSLQTVNLAPQPEGVCLGRAGGNKRSGAELRCTSINPISVVRPSTQVLQDELPHAELHLVKLVVVIIFPMEKSCFCSVELRSAGNCSHM